MTLVSNRRASAQVRAELATVEHIEAVALREVARGRAAEHLVASVARGRIRAVMYALGWLLGVHVQERRGRGPR